MESNIDNFNGCKLAYLFNEQLLVYKRDNIPGIPYPGLWDFPGGGRDGDETPETCVLRELQEEFAIKLDESRFIYKKKVKGFSGYGHAYFFVAYGTQQEVDNIVFGDEGQYWEFMSIADYLSHPDGIVSLKDRLQGFLNNSNEP